jgi:hypothetical protein
MYAAGHIQMESINMKKAELLKKVQENRTKHVEEYDETVQAYREACHTELGKAIRFNLPCPHNHVEDYDQVISMLEMSVDEIIEVTAEVFACYVLDRWEWKMEFEATRTMYCKA